MLHLSRVYSAFFRVSFAVQLQYRTAAAFWIIGAVMQPTVYLVVWATVAAEQGGSVNGLTIGDFAAYYIVLMFLEHLTFTWIMWEFDYRIREGEISSALLKPIHPIHADLMDNVAYKLIGLVMMVPCALALGWAFRPNFTTTPIDLLLFIPVFFLTFALRFSIGYTLGLAAFWTNRITALNSIYFVSRLFFSGRLSPIELMPPTLQTIANILPFKWFVAYPAELLLGRYTLSEALQGLSIQMLWVAIMVVTLRFVWRRGTRKYAAFGS